MRDNSSVDSSFLKVCSEQHARLYELWNRKRAGRLLPKRSDFSFEELLPWIGGILIYEVVAGDSSTELDFIYRLVGLKIAHAVDIDLTGLRVSEKCYLKNRSYAIGLLCALVETKSPLYRNEILLCADNRSYAPEILLLPLSSNYSDVDKIFLFAGNFREKNGSPIKPTSNSPVYANAAIL